MSWRAQRGPLAAGVPAAWREALLPLKQEIQEHGCASTGVVQAALSTLTAQPAAWASHASEPQVADDLVLLVQQLSVTTPQQAPSSDNTALIRARTCYCQLITAAVQQRQRGPQLQGQGASTVCAALRSWADAQGGTGGEQQLQHGALAALGAVLPDCIGSLPAHERTACLALLTSVVQSACRPSVSAQKPPGAAASEAVQLAAAAVGALCVRAGSATLTASELASILQCLVDALSAACSGNRGPPEDSQHARYLSTLLRSLTAAVAESKRAWVPHTGAIAEALRRLFTYCAVPLQPLGAGTAATNVTPSSAANAAVAESTRVTAPPPSAAPAAAAPAAAPAATSAGRYRPPHARGSSHQDQQPAAQSTSTSTISSPQSRRGSRAYSDDSEASDWDSSSSTGSTAALDRCRGSRVRLALLGCLQAMIQADSKALHQQWTSLMPLHQPLQARPLSPTLITVILHDPLPKVRSMAAATLLALLEGPPQRLYMAVAEAKTVQRPAVRGFTTLSASLGHMVASVHAGLLHAVSREQSAPVLAVVLRALGVLCSAAPYERLPASLLPDVVKGVRAKLQRGGAGATGEDGAVVVAALACVAQALSTKLPSAALGVYLLQDAKLGAAAMQAASAATEPEPGAQAMAGSAVRSPPPTNAEPAPQPSSSGSVQMQREMQVPSIAPKIQGVSLTSLSWRDRGSDSTAAAQRPAAPMVEQLLDFAADGAPLLRIEALAALRGCCVHYPAVLPAPHWPRILAAARLSLSATRVVARSPRGSSSSIGSLPSNSQQQQRGTWMGAGGAVSSTIEAAASASTSPEDKAAQHAVKLLGEFLGALALQAMSCDSSEHAATASSSRSGSSSTTQTQAAVTSAVAAAPSTPAELAVMWQQALDLLLPDATQHASYMIRSAALGALSDLGPAQLPALPLTARQSLLAAVADAVRTDPVPAVRCAACKTLGGPALVADAEARSLVARTLAAAVKDGTATVRVAAAWAVANLCDALRVDAAVETEGQSDVPAREAAEASTSGRDGSQSAQQQQQQQWQGQQGTAPLPCAELSSVCSAALAACQDSDKVRANGVRALGNLMAAWQPCWAGSTGAALTDAAGPTGDRGSNDWLGPALAALQSCLATGNMKVQWNACYAIGGLMQNEALLHLPEVRGAIDTLLLVLVMLVRDSSNFKIRTHSAAALAAPSERSAYGHIFPDALLVVSSALEHLETGATATHTAAGATVSATSAKAPAASTGHNSNASTSDGAGGEAEDPRFPNFKYAAGLATQLSRTLLRLLSLATPADAQRLREPLVRRLEFVMGVLRREAAASAAQQQQQASEAAAARSSNARGCTQRSSGGGGPGMAAMLPSDPFGLGPSSSAGNDSLVIPSTAAFSDLGELVKAAAGGLLHMLQDAQPHSPGPPAAALAARQAELATLAAVGWQTAC